MFFSVAGKKRHQLADYLKSHLSRSLDRTVRRTCLKGVMFLFIHRCSMYGIFTYIYHKVMINVGKYSIHGAFGIDLSSHQLTVVICCI